MAKSQTDLVNRALAKIGAVGSGQTASAEDVTIATDALTPLVEELNSLGVCYVPLSSDTSEEVIEDRLFQGLATLLALDISAEFGGPVPGDDARQNGGLAHL